MRNRIINAALQILPKATSGNIYEIIDKAIEVIQQSGLKYKVCPFETVIEGEYDDILQVIKNAQEICFENGADELIVHIKIQQSREKDVFIKDKMEKYE